MLAISTGIKNSKGVDIVAFIESQSKQRQFINQACIWLHWHPDKQLTADEFHEQYNQRELLPEYYGLLMRYVQKDYQRFSRREPAKRSYEQAMAFLNSADTVGLQFAEAEQEAARAIWFKLAFWVWSDERVIVSVTSKPVNTLI